MLGQGVSSLLAPVSREHKKPTLELPHPPETQTPNTNTPKEPQQEPQSPSPSEDGELHLYFYISAGGAKLLYFYCGLPKSGVEAFGH